MTRPLRETTQKQTATGAHTGGLLSSWQPSPAAQNGSRALGFVSVLRRNLYLASSLLLLGPIVLSISPSEEEVTLW